MATESAVNVAPSGSTPIASFTQTQQGSTTVDVQQFSLVDPNGTGTHAVGATVDANGLHVVPQVGTPNSSGSLTASIAANSSSTMSSGVPVTNTKTGTLQHGIFSASQPMLWVMQTLNNSGSPTTVASFYTNAYETYDYRPGSISEVSTVLSTGVAAFQVVATNQGTNTNVPATAYANFFWAEN